MPKTDKAELESDQVLIMVYDFLTLTNYQHELQLSSPGKTRVVHYGLLGRAGQKSEKLAMPCQRFFQYLVEWRARGS